MNIGHPHHAQGSSGLLFSLLLAASMAATSSHAAADACAGEQLPIAGVGNVDGGEARYEMKLQIPGGKADLKPTISLYYGSRDGNSLAGTGWSLGYDGSAIFRCPSQFDQDGYTRSVSYADSDRLCLDGKRLIVIEGEYGKDGSAYLTEIFDGRTVTLVGNLDSPTAYLAVHHRDGAVSMYRGLGKRLGAPAPLYWHRTSYITDAGDSIDYGYRLSPAGEIVPAEIRYTGFIDTSKRRVGRRYIRFEYTERPDVGTSFLGGAESRYHLRLAGISTGTTQEDGTDLPFSTYQFRYRQSHFNGASLLEQVTGGYYNTDGAYRCRYPTTLHWNDHTLAYAPARAIGLEFDPDGLAPAWQPGQPQPDVVRLTGTGDMDADGRVEMLAHRAGAQGMLLHLDMSMQVRRRTPLPTDVLLARRAWDGGSIDTRKLGTADLYGDRDGRIVSLGWWDGGLAHSLDTGIAVSGDVLDVDLDGDGIADLVQGSREDGDHRLFFHRGVTATRSAWRFAPPVPLLALTAPGTVTLETGGFLIGGTDSVLVHVDGRLAHVVMAISGPGGDLSPMTYSPEDLGINPEAVENGFLLVDFNGDGMRDLVFTGADGKWHVQANADRRFLPAQSTGLDDSRSPSGRSSTLRADLDRDHKEELYFPARRMTGFCVVGDGAAPLCDDELAAVAPHMDFGVYHYDSIRFRLDANGHYIAEQRDVPGLVGQANRSSFADFDGDGHRELLAPYDPGISNGRFRQTDGNLSPCPDDTGCGARLVLPAFVDREDRRNGNLPSLSRIRNTATVEHHWNYYPLSNPQRNLYVVPALESPDRYIDSRHIHFRSSMYVAGEYFRTGSQSSSETRYSYGAAVYNTAGRGLQGFKWITVHHPALRQRTVYSFLQKFPFTGNLQRFWVERDRDNKLDFFNAKPGRHPSMSSTRRWSCVGPADHRLTADAGCTPHDHPVFSVEQDKSRRR